MLSVLSTLNTLLMTLMCACCHDGNILFRKTDCPASNELMSYRPNHSPIDLEHFACMKRSF